MDIIDEFKPKVIVLRILAEKRTEAECTVVRPAPQYTGSSFEEGKNCQAT